jgi:hypothetical protein
MADARHSSGTTCRSAHPLAISTTRARERGTDDMETLQQALSRLNDAGFRDRFRAKDGRLHAHVAQQSYPPESLVIEEVLRFEADSSAPDETAVFALRSIGDGIRGTYVVAYGRDMDVEDARMVPRLRVPKAPS